jgi:FkbM family methyltransferase
VNLRWFIRNVAIAWRNKGSTRDFARAMIWIYAASLPFLGMASREWVIGFRYPRPVGRIRLLLRANRGSDAFIHGEVFFHRYYSLPMISTPETVLDLGANSGLATVYFSRAYPQAALACVEPVPGNLRVLSHNLALNEIEAPVIAAAVDSRDGRLKMELAPMDYGHKVFDGGSRPAGTLIEVEALSIPTILERLGWRRIGLLKVDIEGHEGSLFSNDCEWLQCVDAMCIECHETFGEADLKGLAARYGFQPPERLAGTWLLRRAEPENR